MRRALGRTAPLGAIVACLAAAAPAAASDFAVTRTNDPAPNGCRKADCSLREAISAANSHPGPDRVLLKPGKTYTLQIPGPGEDLNATGDLDPTGPLTVESPGPKPATVDGGALDNVFSDFAGITVRRLVIRDAGPGGYGIVDRGPGSVRVIRSTLAGSGAATINEYDAGSVFATRTTISKSVFGAITEYGGGNVTTTRTTIADPAYAAITEFDAGEVKTERTRILRPGYDGLTEFGTGSVTMTRTQIVKPGYAGITEFDAGDVRAQRTAVSDPSRDGVTEFSGGSVIFDRVQISSSGYSGVTQFPPGGLTGTQVKITGSGRDGLGDFGSKGLVLRDSLVAGSGYAGIYSSDDGGMRLDAVTVRGSDRSGVSFFGDGKGTVSGSTIAGNGSAISDGGGIYAGGKQLTVRDSTITANTVKGTGGGIYAAAPLTLVNDTIAGNRAGLDGGGVAANAGKVRMNAVTVARNVADADSSGTGTGGGIFIGASPATTFRVENSLIALNSVNFAGALGPDCTTLGNPFDSRGHNLLTHKPGCTGFNGPVDLVRANPKIGQLAGNGGPTKTIALKAGSPAIGRAASSAPSRDQRGHRRDRDPDIGAFER
ncbi:MAG: right-handed parallel beta-helix repeat-containing protein [Solirubrobacterales bacterium]